VVSSRAVSATARGAGAIRTGPLDHVRVARAYPVPHGVVFHAQAEELAAAGYGELAVKQVG
jgi:hypothetical protein